MIDIALTHCYKLECFLNIIIDRSVAVPTEAERRLRKRRGFPATAGLPRGLHYV